MIDFFFAHDFSKIEFPIYDNDDATMFNNIFNPRDYMKCTPQFLKNPHVWGKCRVEYADIEVEKTMDDPITEDYIIPAGEIVEKKRATDKIIIRAMMYSRALSYPKLCDRQYISSIRTTSNKIEDIFVSEYDLIRYRDIYFEGLVSSKYLTAYAEILPNEFKDRSEVVNIEPGTEFARVNCGYPSVNRIITSNWSRYGPKKVFMAKDLPRGIVLTSFATTPMMGIY